MRYSNQLIIDNGIIYPKKVMMSWRPPSLMDLSSTLFLYHSSPDKMYRLYVPCIGITIENTHNLPMVCPDEIPTSCDGNIDNLVIVNAFYVYLTSRGDMNIFTCYPAIHSANYLRTLLVVLQCISIWQYYLADT